jgi:hypothetical protein
MLNPAFHPGMDLPARKYSTRFLEAFDLARKPAETL